MTSANVPYVSLARVTVAFDVPGAGGLERERADGGERDAGQQLAHAAPAAP